MVNLQKIADFIKFKKSAEVNAALVADFRQLNFMKRYVPYLKEFKFNQTSGQAGDSRSSFKGRGMEFAEVRAYSYGDDVRDIDWRVTARKNQPFTKLYNEEKDREVYLWLDLSKHMRFGTKKELKSVTAAKTAALLGWYALENKDRLGVLIYDGHKTLVFRPKRAYDNWLSVLKKMESVAEQGLYQSDESVSMVQSLQVLRQNAAKHAIVFIISSFDAEHAEIMSQIQAISKYNELYAVNVFDALEDMAPPSGEYLAQYQNEQQLLISCGKVFENNYRQFFAQKRQKIKNFCAKNNCRYREIRTDLPIYKQIRPI